MQQPAHHEIKETPEGFEAFHHGCLIGVFPTTDLARKFLAEQDADDQEFIAENLSAEHEANYQNSL